MSVPTLTVQQQGQGQVSADQLNTFIQSASNVANLRTLTGVTGMEIGLQGTTTPGDSGQGFFYWNATGTAPDDNGVMTVVPNGATTGCWTRLAAIGTGTIVNSVSNSDNSLIISPTTGNVIASLGKYPANTVLANATGVSAQPTAVTLGTGFSLAGSVLNAAGRLLAIQTFTATGAGTYTPTVGMNTCVIELQGGGGGSGGTTGAGSQSAAGGAAGGGAYMQILATAANIGVSAVLSVGVGGAAGISGNNTGIAGGPSTIIINSSTWTANGGNAGGGKASSASAQQGGTAGTGGTNTAGLNATLVINIPGKNGGGGWSNGANGTVALSALGGDSFLGKGGETNQNANTGTAGYNYGGGASGSLNTSGGSATGTPGAQGIIIITEYT